MSSCKACGAPINFVSTPEGRLALDNRMESEGDDRFSISNWEALPNPTAVPVAPNYPHETYVAHRKLCPFSA